MFSEAYTNLNQALRQAKTNKPNFQNIRSLLKSALRAVYEDSTQPNSLKIQAESRIQSAISYTYSRSNPMPSAFSPQTFASMSTPISPFQRNTMGPYGFVKGPMVPAHPQLTPKAWTGADREKQSLILMIQGAINVVRRGL
jgi:hypothetical protein